MSRFDLIQKEFDENTFLKESKQLLLDKIQAGDYPPSELTKEKIIELLAKLIIEQEKSGKQPICGNIDTYEQSDEQQDFYFKILWVVLVEKIGYKQFLSQKEINSLKLQIRRIFYANFLNN